MLNHCRSEIRPITAVDEQSQRRRVADRAIVGKHALVIGVRIVRWKSEYAVRA